MSNKDYHEYLEDLKNRIYKILPLCEENDPNVLKYIQSTLFEVKGLFPVVLSSKKTVWYIRATSVLNNMANNYSTQQLHDSKVHHGEIRREVFNILNLIDREIDEL